MAAVARITSALILVLLLAAPAAAARGAAPGYVSSEPADGAKLHQAPEEVRVTFSEPLDQSSELVVEDHCGNRIDDRKVEISLNEMSVGIEDKPSGHYMVTYAAVGLAGATGTNNGRFAFTVHMGRPCDGDGGNVGGHNHHPGGNEDPNEHGNHGGDTGHPSGHDGGHPSGMQSSGHGEHAGGSAGTAHSGHDMSDMDMDEQHGQHVAAARQRAQRDRRLTGIATGESPFPSLAPDSTAILLALLLCAAFGALGGWLLRVSSPK